MTAMELNLEMEFKIEKKERKKTATKMVERIITKGGCDAQNWFFD